ncbi:hypothetical protein FRX31_033943, partial [Thalictrum thalictroides]
MADHKKPGSFNIRRHISFLRAYPALSPTLPVESPSSLFLSRKNSQDHVDTYNLDNVPGRPRQKHTNNGILCTVVESLK